MLVLFVFFLSGQLSGEKVKMDLVLVLLFSYR